MTRKKLINEYTKAIVEGYAAIFAGAGLSRGAGYADWKNLLRPLAEEIGLDVDKEHDLVTVAQYCKNEDANRSTINSRIVEAFTKDISENENIDILTRLPIQTYWTTNYDHLLEEHFKKNNRKPEVKIDKNQLAITLPNRDVVLYKMHGDVDNPADAVLTKDDYESYDEHRPLFKTALLGDLISKTFLFVGFSFEDPNLEYILGRINTLLGENKRTHYCFFKKINKDEYSDEEEYQYLKAKQDLQVKDLKRYGICAVLVNQYEEITSILREIEKKVLMKNVFISGSAEEYGELWNEKTAKTLAFELSKKLVSKDFKITTGFGLGIGSSVVNGALTEIYKSKYNHITEYLCLRPFPQGIDDVKKQKELYTKYRKDMIEKVGISIFMFGNKKAQGNIVLADGCREEFELAKEHGNIIIPLASTGYIAKELLEEIKQKIDDFKYLEPYLDKLENVTEPTEIVELVMQIIDSI